MSDNIEVQSIDAIAELSNAVERFSARVLMLKQETEGVVSAVRRSADRLSDDAARAVRTAERALDEAEEESDIDQARELLEAAEEREHEVSVAIDEVSSALDDLACLSPTLDQDVGVEGRLAAEFLRRKVGELRQYWGVSSHDAAIVPVIEPSAASNAVPSRPFLTPPSIDELEQYTLPVGWKWVRLTEIDTGLSAPNELHFNKISREQMTSGFERLRRDVLPLLDRNLEAAKTRLRDDDTTHGIRDTSGKLGAFEAFFSTLDPIHLQRRRGEFVYGVDNGRHRIEVARSLGWPAVPAKTQEV